jgi:hypothetical protein
MVRGESARQDILMFSIEKNIENHREKCLQHVQRIGGRNIPKLYVQQSDWKL